MDENEDQEIREYQKLVEKEKGKMGKLKEVKAAENNTILNLNEVTRANAGNPLIASNIRKNASPMTKRFLATLAWLILFALIMTFIFAIMFMIKVF